MPEAVTAYGMNERTIRRHLKEGTFTGIKVRTLQGREWRIRPPDPDVARTLPGASEKGAGRASTQAGQELIPVSDIERFLAPLAADRERLAAQVDELHAARLNDARQAAEEIGRLRGQLAATQGELERLRAVPPSPSPIVEPERARRRRRWPWER